MATNGPARIQACAIRLTRLNPDGSPTVSSVSMIQDEGRAIAKCTWKPNMFQGVDITPASACGVPIISYKDCDRYKRWEIMLSMGDWDPEQMELVAGGAVLTSPGSAGRGFNDGAVTQGEFFLTSPAAASFVPADVGRPVAGANIPGGATIVQYISATQVRMNLTATASGSGESITLGAIPAQTTGYQYPHLLLTACENGIGIELWSRQIVRGTGYPGTAGYPSAGTPTTPGSPYVRTGIFRAFLYHDAGGAENKESTTDYSGWALENPNWSTGPVDDWRTGMMPGSAGGVPLDTSAWCNMNGDFQLPAPLQPGYQSVTF
jgi:hypothetical protein